ncbi:MAG: isoquinoline 1-oxidoreductase [Hyphomicrobium sp.]|nr:isoquinoline 1-oxidoreductase [Hyphomicrobium sp.]PPC82414.1 MAG: isoquinoline 1-oxidoreductase [Hyphomicrobium sp.]
MPTIITVNGERRSLDADPETPLLWVLRDELELTGTKFGCGIAQCGACTVHVKGEPQRSCQITLKDAAGLEITTIEGLSGKVAEAVRKAWASLDVVQCGYCQSGQVMAAVALLQAKPKPTDADIDTAFDGNICRCNTYTRIRAGVHAGSKMLGG